MVRLLQWTAMSFIGLSSVFSCHAALGMHTGFKDSSGNIAFSEEFVRDYNAAEFARKATGSADPFHALLKKYRHPNERAELELTLGVIYSQRTGFVAPEKAVPHLTRALDYDLPDEAYLNTLLWRAGSFEQLGKREDAIRDHLRGLVACTRHDLPSEWPELLPPIAMFSIRPENEAEREAKRDYERYRSRVLLQQHVMRQRGYFVQGIRRLCQGVSESDTKLLDMLEQITPDPRKHASVVRLLKPEDAVVDSPRAD
jgi:hypothetical protein